LCKYKLFSIFTPIYRDAKFSTTKMAEETDIDLSMDEEDAGQ